MSIKNILITGANRGIGYELCKQLSQLGSTEAVIATTRSRQNSSDLNQLSTNNSKIHVLELDVKDYNTYDKFSDDCKQIIGTKGLNLMINNAGILSRDSLSSVTAESLSESFNVNAMAPLLLTKKLLPLLKASAKNADLSAVVNISAILGTSSINIEAGSQWYSYRISKTSLNMITRLLAFDLTNHGIKSIAIHPGWVKTQMGTDRAPLEPDVAVNSIVNNILLKISDSMNGKLFNYDGKQLRF